MSIENLFRRHVGSSGGYRNTGTFIAVKGDDGETIDGIHFHSGPVNFDQATKLLRESGWILNDESVNRLINCGKDQNGVEGHAALTDRMLDDSNDDPELQRKFEDGVNRMLENSSIWPRKI